MNTRYLYGSATASGCVQHCTSEAVRRPHPAHVYVHTEHTHGCCSALKQKLHELASRHRVLKVGSKSWGTLKPAFLARRKQVPTAATVCPRLVSRATSSYVLCRPISKRVQPYASI